MATAETTNRLTFAGVQTELRALGVTIGRTHVAGEFLVRIKGSPKGHGSYTDDLEDALGTGKAMAAEHLARPHALRAASLRAQAAELDRDARTMLLDRAQVMNPHNRKAAAEMRETAAQMRAQADRLDAQGAA